jgi:purine-nucleoside phosphorylase
MEKYFTLAEIDETVGVIRARITDVPRIAMILGSGLGSLAESVENPTIINYDQLPHWPVSTVQGHIGRLVIGRLENQNVLMMQGRSHFYEGYSMTEIGLPVRVMTRLGTEIMIVTNAAGAVNPEFNPGELMLITDQFNLIGMAGFNPLRGPNLEEIGPRFPDMSQAYDRELCTKARQIARKEKTILREGVYACLAGPSFETPADLRFLRNSGVDAVGMSTVPEVITARHGGIRVMGISGISNKANLDGNTITTHEEVLEAGNKIVPQLLILIRNLLQQL